MFVNTDLYIVRVIVLEVAGARKRGTCSSLEPSSYTGTREFRFGIHHKATRASTTFTPFLSFPLPVCLFLYLPVCFSDFHPCLSYLRCRAEISTRHEQTRVILRVINASSLSFGVLPWIFPLCFPSFYLLVFPTVSF